MCGIAGFIDRDIQNPTVLETMLSQLHHRGPDSKGTYGYRGLQMGVTRLAINDLKTGDQPLFNREKNIALIYNGEIYNHRNLREELGREGFEFRTQSDGEVICHLYEKFGEGVFEHLDGMFALALFIEEENKLILARDIPGEKPLYYYSSGEDHFVFASDLNSLVRHPRVDTRIRTQALWDLPTFGWVPEPETVYENVRVLPRSHYLVVDSKGQHLKRYRNRFHCGSDTLNDDSILRQTRRTVVDSIKSRLLSDVPIGCCLSGGLDSSIVAKTISDEREGDFNTYTIGFENVNDPHHGRADEAVLAEQFAKKLGSRHRTIRVTGRMFRENLQEFVHHGGQPFCISSGLGILSISKAAQEDGVKVLLSGDGADENFGGYSWYSYLDNSHGEETDPDPSLSFTNYGVSLEKRLAAINCYRSAKKAWAWHYYASEEEKRSIFSDEMFGAASSSLRIFEEHRRDEWKAIDFIRNDRQLYLVNEMLQKVDRMTMAHSVEGRVPFTAPAVLSLVERLQFKHLVRSGTLKWALKGAFSKELPAEILERPKHGFNVPLEHWYRTDWNDLISETFSDGSNLRKHGIIDAKSSSFAAKLVADKRRVHGHTLFAFIVLNYWLSENTGISFA